MSQEESQFLVNPYDDPVVLKINGKASFLNSAPVKDLFDQLVDQGKLRFIIDFQHCTGMDSTFLGILAGLGVRLLRLGNKGSVVLCRLGARNMELIRNLGLHRILTLDDGSSIESMGDGADLQSLRKGEPLNELENARLVLKAHENLVDIDASNKTRFQDVIAFLKNQVEED